MKTILVVAGDADMGTCFTVRFCKRLPITFCLLRRALRP